MLSLSKKSKVGLEYTTVVALDRDATRIIRLTLRPPASSAVDKATSWLLVHGIPVTVSLSSVLRDVLDAQEEAVSKNGKTSSSKTEWFEAMRIAYMVSEIHSYCLIIKCISSSEAEMLKTVLEKRAAPGVNTPVDFVKDEAWMDIMGEPRKVDLLLTILDSPASEERRSTPNRTPLLNPTDAPSRMTTKVQNVLKDEICPICQVEPLTADACLVTLCQHRFHVRCYAQLPIDAADCPMCRFSLYDLLNDAKCQTCRTYDDLWTCLICGFIGCGRGRKGHSHEHYEECRHSCAMQMNTNRIWNFKTRMFLHQEIAVLFGEEKDTGGTFLGNLDFDWTGLTTKQEEEAEDEQLQLALEESKEKAVLEFYANVQKDLIKEQHEWYITEMRKRIAATGPTATVVTADHDAVFDTLESVMLAEHHHRRYLAECYVAEVRDLCTRSATEAYAISKAYRLKMTELKEQNLLLTHTVEGLQGKLVRAKERLVEAKRRGGVSRQLNKDKIAALQKELEDAFA